MAPTTTVHLRAISIALLALSLGACSCSRQADDDALTAPSTSASASAPAPADATPAQAVAVDPRAAAPSQIEAASTLHAYLQAITAKRWEDADRYWTGGKPPSRPGDTAVRAIADLQSARIDNQQATALDKETPPRAVEIPVTIRVQADGRTSRISGWYRMRVKVDGSGWEITSASMQPVLD